MEKREINMLIAEKVFGWSVTYHQLINVISVLTEDDEITIPENFCPTEKIEDAWKVLREIKSNKGIQADISTSDFSVRLYRWETDETPPYRYKRTLSVVDDTLAFDEIPKAICLATLQALEKIKYTVRLR
jgi:hypothetical protein